MIVAIMVRMATMVTWVRMVTTPLLPSVYTSAEVAGP
jgi:hypothetical protein